MYLFNYINQVITKQFKETCRKKTLKCEGGGANASVQTAVFELISCWNRNAKFSSW